MGAELVDLMVGEIDLVMKLAPDALEPINLEVEGGHLFARGGEQRLSLVPLGFAAGELGAEGIECLLKIVGVVSRGGLCGLELGGVSGGVATSLGQGGFEIGGVGGGLGAGGGDLGETNLGGREGAGEVARVGLGLAVAGLELPDVVAGQSLRF